MKLLYDPFDQKFYVLYRAQGKDLLFKVDQVKPTMLSREIENAMFLSKHEREAVIEEMEEFAKKEIEKLENGF